MLLPLLLGTLLSACATVGPAGGDGAQLAWARHRASLGAMENWDLQGRIAVRTAQEAWQARLVWRQRRERFEIDVLSVFGQRLAQLSGGPGGVELRLSRGRRFRARDAAGLLQEQLGWSLPVAGLRHWVLGLPAPGAVAQRTLDGDGRLLALVQQGWTIGYRRYRSTDGRDLPGQVILQRDDLRLRLVVDRWGIGGRG
ncbi:MAG: lipoprotein insertase outer membrane protein LolB [Gammaproteobacteria bacterium]